MEQKMRIDFEFIVRNFFILSDGRTIFMGEMLGYQGDIQPCVCDIFVKGEKTQAITVYPEIPSRGKNNYRLISTIDKVTLTDSSIKAGEVTIKFQC